MSDINQVSNALFEVVFEPIHAKDDMGIFKAGCDCGCEGTTFPHADGKRAVYNKHP